MGRKQIPSSDAFWVGGCRLLLQGRAQGRGKEKEVTRAHGWPLAGTKLRWEHMLVGCRALASRIPVTPGC